MGFPGGLVVKNLPASVGDMDSIPGSGRSPPWRRKWQPTHVFLPKDSHGQRSLVGYSPWGHKRDMIWKLRNNNNTRTVDLPDKTGPIPWTQLSDLVGPLFVVFHAQLITEGCINMPKHYYWLYLSLFYIAIESLLIYQSLCLAGPIEKDLY